MSRPEVRTASLLVILLSASCSLSHPLEPPPGGDAAAPDLPSLPEVAVDVTPLDTPDVADAAPVIDAPDAPDVPVTPDVPDDRPAADAPEVGCRDNSECDDGDPCTTNTCDRATGRCTSQLVTGCCTNAAQCDDGDGCTTDACGSDRRCAHAAVMGCCATAAQCDDMNRCTRDECVSNRCQSSAITGCCMSNAQCDDRNMCTNDTCNMATNLCERSPVTNCCGSAAQCDDGDPCTVDACEMNACTNRPAMNCCTSDTQCDDRDPCTTDRCAMGRCERPRTPPPGDACTNAVTLTPSATLQTRGGDTNACAGNDHGANNDLVYTLALPAGTHVVYADTFGSGFNTRLTLHDGCAGTALASSEDRCGTPQSQLVEVVAGGRTVSLIVSGTAASDRGNVVLHYLVAPVPMGLTYTRIAPGSAPMGAAMVSGSTGDFFRSCARSTGASDTLRPGCTMRDGQGPEQLYLTATCPGARPFSATTCGDGQLWDSVVSVQNVGSPNREIACNDDACNSRRSSTGGMTPASASPMLVAVDGYYDLSCGNFALRLSGFYF